MIVKELIEELKKCPPDYKVEYHAGTDHIIVDYCKPDGPHKRTGFWMRRRKVVILK
jgi:hypothetical protein